MSAGQHARARSGALAPHACARTCTQPRTLRIIRAREVLGQHAPAHARARRTHAHPHTRGAQARAHLLDELLLVGLGLSRKQLDHAVDPDLELLMAAPRQLQQRRCHERRGTRALNTSTCLRALKKLEPRTKKETIIPRQQNGGRSPRVRSRTQDRIRAGMVFARLQSSRASARRTHTWRPQVAAGVMLTLTSLASLPRAAVAGGIPRRLSPAQMSDLHGLAAKLVQRNPTLAAGIADGIVNVDTRSIRSVDALGDALLSVSLPRSLASRSYSPAGLSLSLARQSPACSVPGHRPSCPSLGLVAATPQCGYTPCISNTARLMRGSTH